MASPLPTAFDEMNGWDGQCRAAYREVRNLLDTTAPEHLDLKSKEAEILFRPGPFPGRDKHPIKTC